MLDYQAGGAKLRLEKMMLARAYEDKLAWLGQQQEHFPMSCSAYGQEAAAVGVISVLEKEDLILTNHRSAAHIIARGGDPSRIMAEVMGKSTGYCQGKSGSLHVSAKDLGVILTSTIVGGELSLAPGVALSKKMLKQAGIVVCFFGDGAACEGIFHESLNLASVWNLPVLYVLENNQWQAFVHRRETMLTDRMNSWADSYAMQNASVDGNDVEAVRTAALDAVNYIRRTGSPYLLEAYTYRTKGHYSIDDQAYVDKDELQHWSARDPILLQKQRLLGQGEITESEFIQLQNQVSDRIDSAAAVAEAAPYPALETLHTDVYAQS
ncbi:MAG TPA: thiamine pyrophosphate-dependent dehydrogenase E1 component subunit alpha [Pseudomonadales bacterium]|nr:thiamine pyrophosphate-dependent dehydrogenase E1 component subunit alpha [Pseudomonadales bacterium]